MSIKTFDELDNFIVNGAEYKPTKRKGGKRKIKTYSQWLQRYPYMIFAFVFLVCATVAEGIPYYIFPCYFFIDFSIYKLRKWRGKI